MLSDGDYQYLYKIVLVGDTSVGKSSLLLRFARNDFDLSSRSTIGVEFASKKVRVQGRVVKAQIWDTGGQERYRPMMDIFYRGAVGALLVYDITSRTSFEDLEDWITELRAGVNLGTIILLVGNKCDLEDLRAVDRTEAEDFAQEHRMLFLEASALEAKNVELAFIKLLSEIYMQQTTVPSPSTHSRSSSVQDRILLHSGSELGQHECQC